MGLDQRGRARPQDLCDVVMKGGIASGVVYPRAVCRLATRYRLKNVGGTSAGAIAAAGAAAAEYGRAGGGFERLAELPREIGAAGKLASLFQPQPATRALHRVLIASVDRTRPRWLHVPLAALRGFWLTALLAAVPGLALGTIAILALVGDGASLLRIAALIGGLLLLGAVAIAVPARMAWQATRTLPANGYGLCSGMPGEDGTEALTPWLANLIQDLAGRGPSDPPLTFGDLWAGPDAPTPGDPAKPWLRLEMMTTNVTNRRGERMPWASREYWFDPEELGRLFPPEIVRRLCDNPPPLTGSPRRLAEGQLRRRLMEPLRPLPEPADLPIVVATRMSLSFPVLLSAVPLWRVDWSRAANGAGRDAWSDWQAEHLEDWEEIVADPQRLAALVAEMPPPRAEHCWFSDGGISSNFPVHFFDAALPRHPTFAINLRPFHPDRGVSEDEAENVWMVPTPGEGISDWWYRLTEPSGRWSLDRRLPGFLAGLVRTMQNRVDEAQMRVPGYRERVAHVSLTSTEGGMNLAMSGEVIERLTERGRHAADKLLAAYADPPARPEQVSWDAHRWVRFRATLTALAELLRSFDDGFGAPVGDGVRTYAQLRDRGDGESPSSYPVASVAQRELLTGLCDGIADVVAALGDEADALASGSPRPQPVARIVPSDGGVSRS